MPSPVAQRSGMSQFLCGFGSVVVVLGVTGSSFGGICASLVSLAPLLATLYLLVYPIPLPFSLPTRGPHIDSRCACLVVRARFVFAYVRGIECHRF